MPAEFSRRTGWDRSENRIALAIKRRRASGGTIRDLTEANPTVCGFAYPVELLTSLADPGNLRYEPDARGLEAPRRAVAAYYAEMGITVDAGRIFLAAGTSEAYSHLLRLLCNAGDRISVPRPGYPLLDHLAALNDVEVVRHGFAFAGGKWRLDERAFARSVRDNRPRAVLAVNPNNPTGQGYALPERAAIVAALAESGGAVIADEVFLDYAEPGGERESFTSARQTLTFTLGGVSKMLGLPQMKLAWIAVTGPDRDVEEACGRLEVITDAYLSVSTPAQRSLEAWMKLRPRLQAPIRERIASNRAFLTAECLRTGVESMPGGGWHAVLKPDCREDDEGLAIRLIEEEGVITQPGYYFDFDGGPYLVVSLLPEPGVFEEGIRRLAGAAVRS